MKADKVRRSDIHSFFGTRRRFAPGLGTWGTVSITRDDVFTHNFFLQTEALTQRSLCTAWRSFHTGVFYTQTHLRTETFVQKNLFPKKPCAQNFYKQELQRSFYTKTLSPTKHFTQSNFYIEKPLFARSRLYAQKLYTEQSLHRVALRADDFARRSSHTQEPLHTDAFTHRNFYTHTHIDMLLHAQAFTHKRLYTEKLLHRQAWLWHRKLLHKESLHPEAFVHWRFAQSRFYTQMPLHKEAFTQRSLST